MRGVGDSLLRQFGKRRETLFAALLIAAFLIGSCFVPDVRVRLPSEVVSKFGTGYLLIAIVIGAIGISGLGIEIFSRVFPGPSRRKLVQLKRLHDDGLMSKVLYDEAVSTVLDVETDQITKEVLYSFAEWIRETKSKLVTGQVRNNIIDIVNLYIGERGRSVDED